MDDRWRRLGDLLVNYSTEVKRGEKVLISMLETDSYPLVVGVYEACIKVGALPQVVFQSERLNRSLLKYGSNEQIDTLPELERHGMEWADVYIGLRAASNPHELWDIDSEKLAKLRSTMGKIATLRWQKISCCLVRIPRAVLAHQAELAEKSPAGSKGLIVLLYFAGERTPIHDPASKGIIFGLTLAHTKGDIYRSVLEGVSYSIRHNLQEMSKEGVVPRRILLAGGVLKNPLWVKLIADITGFEMNIPNQLIGASFGDAFLAAMGIKEFESVQEIEKWVKVKSRVQPDVSWKRVYDIKYHVYLELYKRTKDLMEIIHKLQDELSNIS